MTPDDAIPEKRPYPGHRVTPDELAQYAKVMREHGVHDFASGDTRILISPHSLSLTLSPSDDPLRPLIPGGMHEDRPLTEEEAKAKEDEILYASVP